MGHGCSTQFTTRFLLGFQDPWFWMFVDWGVWLGVKGVGCKIQGLRSESKFLPKVEGPRPSLGGGGMRKPSSSSGLCVKVEVHVIHRHPQFLRQDAWV